MIGRNHRRGRTTRRPSGIGWLLACAMAFNAVALASCGGCATTIVAPAQVDDPVAVYIADYGRHSSIILPRSKHVLTEYTYGEWQWYAMGESGTLGVIRAVLLPSQGALGRRTLDAQPNVSWWENLGFVHLYEVSVERELAASLLERLDEQWEQAAQTRLYNEAFDLEFVHHPQPYFLFTNSNPTTARWLRELGCEVRGSALLSNWRLAGPDT